MAGLEEFERGTLDALLASTEARLAAQVGHRDPALERLAHETRLKLGFVERKVDQSKTEERERATQEAAIARLAQEEFALTAREREAFGGLLKRDFFAKKDFGALEQFYAQTWDRLSDRGKDAMSHRIWEGVRRDEYVFSELPAVVRQKEMDHAFQRLRGGAVENPDRGRIPDRDREDFVRAYEAGKREEAAKILDREGFKRSMFRGDESKPIEQSKAVSSRDEEAKSVVATVASQPATPPRRKSAEYDGGLDVTALDLSGVKLAEATQEVSSGNIPIAKGTTASRGPSLGGS